jgi:diaminopimelate decarboxylase
MRRIDNCLSVRGDRLFIEDCDTVEIAASHGTPLYVMSELQLRWNVQRIGRAFRDRWPEGPVNVLPSIKANLALALRRILVEEGAGCDAFGPGELYAALRAGVTPELISLNGPKDQALVDRAVMAGVKITLDHAEELDLVRRAIETIGREALVRPRIRPDLGGLDQPSDWQEELLPVSTVAQIYKAGIPAEDLLAMGPDLLGTEGLRVTGVHVHVGRHRTEPEYWRQVIGEVVSLLAEMREAWSGFEPREIDLGGGLPVPRDPFGREIARIRGRPVANRPVELYAETITSALRIELADHGFTAEGITLEVEPGRALYGDAGIHLTTVRRLKSQTRPFSRVWVETDSTENFLPDVFLEHNRWFFVVANKADSSPTQVADIVGASCNPDRIVPEAELPKVEAGDIIAILDTGAYQDALASNFNALPRPATVLVNGDRWETIKRAETIEDVFRRDIIPERLRGTRMVVLEEAKPAERAAESVATTEGGGHGRR